MTTPNVFLKIRMAAIAAAVVVLAVPAAQAGSIEQFRSAVAAEGLRLESFVATPVEGLLVVRGKARSHSTFDRVDVLAREAGFARVANLVRVEPGPDDASIERAAERALSTSRSLEGCVFTSVRSVDGVLEVEGVIESEIQEDVARQMLRRLDGVTQVRLAVTSRG